MCRVLMLILLFAPVLVAPAAAMCPTPVCVYLPIVSGPAGAGPAAIVLSNHSAFTIDDNHFLRVVGEVQNMGSATLRSVRVSVTLFNGQQPIATNSAYTVLKALLPGDRTCFNIIMGKPAAWTSYQFDAVDSELASAPLPALTFSDIVWSLDQMGIYRVIGKVQNESPAPVRNTEAIATLYNTAGTVLDCNFASVNSVDLAPNQASSFGILFFDRRPYTNVETFRLQVTNGLP